MKKLLWLSDSPRIPFVGQSVVGRECLKRLQKFYNVEALGYGDAELKEGIKVPYNVIPCHRSDMADVNKVSAYLDLSKPDVLLMSHDPWMLPCIGELKKRFPQIKFIGYLTVDGEPPYYGWYNMIKPYDKIITPARFTETALHDRWLDLNIDYVPYGINHEIFHVPKQGKTALKRDITASYRGTAADGYIDIENKFVGIYCGANQDRKNLGLIHEAWREFEKGKEHAVRFLLFVHSADLKVEVGSYDLSVFVHDTKTFRVIPQAQPTEIIGQFMAASDILFHPSNGEGFGLTVAEAMACGTVPVILPYAAVSDFCTQENSYQVPYITHVGGYHTHRAVTSVENAVEVLNRAFKNTEERITLAENAIKDSQKFTWDNCVIGLKRSIDETLKYDRNSVYAYKVK